MNELQEFYRLSLDFCKFVHEEIQSEETIDALLSFLMRLYLSAMTLPQPELEEATPQIRQTMPVGIRFKTDMATCYREVFDPFEEEPPIFGELKDDLAGIVSDLQDGIEAYESGLVGRAAFTWRDGSEFYWGNHAVDAIRALHAMRRNRTVKTWR
jgi:hypothetical protein